MHFEGLEAPPCPPMKTIISYTFFLERVFVLSLEPQEVKCFRRKTLETCDLLHSKLPARV
jgi:hypothetical protein